MSSFQATRRASARSSSVQQPPYVVSAADRLSYICIDRPTTSWPAALRMYAAVEESTPPDMATAIFIGDGEQGTGDRWCSRDDSHLSPVPCALSPNTRYRLCMPGNPSGPICLGRRRPRQIGPLGLPGMHKRYRVLGDRAQGTGDRWESSREHHLSPVPCSPSPMKIAVAMSGGVDSSTAAYILKDAGHDVVGLSMQMYDNLSAAETTYGGCCTLDDLADARRVAWKLDIPHFTLNLERNFHEKVITPFVQSYLNGTTPSPCVLCNTHVKFDLFHQKAQAIGAEKIATGHYARITARASCARRSTAPRTSRTSSSSFRRSSSATRSSPSAR